MKQITPYLFFENNCRAAVNYYKDTFNAELYIMTVGDSPMAEKMPDQKDRVMHAAVMKDKQLMLMASDTMLPGQKADMGEGVYNTIICDSKEEIDMLFNKLVEEGTVNMPLEEAFFGWFGSLTDKFGVKWLLQFSHDNAGN